ncbi:hypothetical protein LJR143_002868 [Pseudoxanthomonas sp. LjRoot143]|uniref:hypothetical protein n=1 Tax=Pseudoxanthomonas sp. LjRoot143 TaxID=3342266 RepID=UPI003ED14FEB
MTAAITIHFRKPELTSKCVDSLLADGWDPILVWDNSADGGESLKALEAQYAPEPRVRLARNAVNLGFGKGMNAGLALLGRQGYSGPVLLVNNDALVVPGMRLALGEKLSGGTALLAPRLMQDGQEQGWLYYQPWLALVTRRPLPGSFAYLSGCCLLVERPDNALPLFDEDFFMYGEDVELSWRMYGMTARLHLLDRSFVLHEGSASSGPASAAYERFLVRSHWLLAEKLASNALEKLLMYVLRVPVLFARASVRAWRYRSMMPLRALSTLVHDG